MQNEKGNQKEIKEMPNRRKKENPWLIHASQSIDKIDLDKMNIYDKQYILGCRKGEKLFLESVHYKTVLEQLHRYCQQDRVPLALYAYYKDGIVDGYKNAERNS